MIDSLQAFDLLLDAEASGAKAIRKQAHCDGVFILSSYNKWIINYGEYQIIYNERDEMPVLNIYERDNRVFQRLSDKIDADLVEIIKSLETEWKD